MIADTKGTGFSLVEVIVAMLILTVGVLAMGASTGHVMSQIQSSELRTERMQVVRETAEVLRSTDWASLQAECDGGFADIDTPRYDVSCSLAQPSANLRRLMIITSGPGFSGTRVVPTVVDTFTISIAEPVS